MAVAAFASPSTDRDFADINITPLVDVLLVLLIIFMVAAPTLTKAIDFDLPQDSKIIPPPRDHIRLAIRADGSLTWNGVSQPHGPGRFRHCKRAASLRTGVRTT